MKKQVFMVMSAIALLLTSSCKKKDDSQNVTTNPPKPLTKAEMLMNGEWIETDAKSGGVSIWNQVPACNRDDITRFKTGGKYELDAGTQKCSSEPQIRTYTWSLTKQDLFVVMNNGSEDLEYQIQELTDKKLRLLYVNPDFGINLEVIYDKK